MHSIFYVSIIFSLVINFASAQPPPGSETISKIYEIFNIYKEKCRANGGQSAYQNLANLETGTALCDVGNYPSLDAFCANHSVTTACFEKYVDLVKPCLDADEKYLPDFFWGLHKSLVEQVCAKGFLDTFEKLNTANCSQPLAEFGQNIFIEKCLNQLRFITDLSKPKYSLSKQLVCSDFKTIQKCFNDTVKNTCTKPEVGLRFFTPFAEGLLKDCQGSGSGWLSGSFLIILLCVIFQRSLSHD